MLSPGGWQHLRPDPGRRLRGIIRVPRGCPRLELRRRPLLWLWRLQPARGARQQGLTSGNSCSSSNTKVTVTTTPYCLSLSTLFKGRHLLSCAGSAVKRAYSRQKNSLARSSGADLGSGPSRCFCCCCCCCCSVEAASDLDSACAGRAPAALASARALCASAFFPPPPSSNA